MEDLWYWNSNTRFNRVVKILGVNGENYAIECDGHVYVVPKRNISQTKRVFEVPETTAPKPETDYWFTLTADQWRCVTKRPAFNDGPWELARDQIARRVHSEKYTKEWFFISPDAAMRLLVRYHYPSHLYEKDIRDHLPAHEAYYAVVSQIWEEKVRRDGITPK